MAGPPNNHHQNPSFSKPPRYPSSCVTPTTVSTSAEPQFRIPNPNPIPNDLPSTSNSPITMSQEDQILARSDHLTRAELLRRRSHQRKELIKIYKDQYWALMEDLKTQHREYYWKYGVSPYKKESKKRRRLGQEGENGTDNAVEAANGENGTYNAVEANGENGAINDGCNGVKSDQFENKNCGTGGCKAKAMALTDYCHLHILQDKKQVLYTGCTNTIRSSQKGPIVCGKPTLASTVPALCEMHFPKAQKQAARALKDAGYNASSTNKPPPKLHVLAAAFVNLIQSKRRNQRNAGKLNSVVKEEHVRYR